MRGLFPLSAYSPHGDAQTGTKSGGEHPQEHTKTTTQNRANTPKSLTAQTEPRYYGQVPIRGCSLMVKPQSSKLITRVRFPSSPRDLGSRRFRVEALSFSLEGMTGIPSACGFVSSRARNPHAPARHPLHKSCSRLPGIASGRKCIPSRARDFRPPARHPLENYPERIAGTASTCGFVSSRTRNPHAPTRHPRQHTEPLPHLPHLKTSPQ